MNLLSIERDQITVDPRIKVDELAVSLLIDQFEIGMRAGHSKTLKTSEDE
jgi:hypothetical protein